MRVALVFASVLLVSMAAANPFNRKRTSSALITVIEIEEACVRQGGICMPREDCKAGNLVKVSRGALCPQQAHLGVDCCYTT